MTDIVPQEEPPESPSFTSFEDILRAYDFVETEDDAAFEKDASELHVVNAPHKLPKQVQDFIRLQNERAFRETGEALSMIPQVALESNYGFDGVTLKKLGKKKKKDYLKRFLEQMEEFIGAICQTYDRATEVKGLYNVVHNNIYSILENLDDDVVSEIMPKVGEYHAELHEAKQAIVAHKEVLKTAPSLDRKTVAAINEDLEIKAEKIVSIGQRFRTRVLNILSRREEEEEKESLSPDLRTHLMSDMRHAAHDPTPHYHAPVVDAMPLRFSSSAGASAGRGGYEDPLAAPESESTEHSSSDPHTDRS
jgi:hypothetical protein